jgi:hypothetical protein
LAKYNSQTGFLPVLGSSLFLELVGKGRVYVSLIGRSQKSKNGFLVLTLGQWSSTIIGVVLMFEWSLKKIKEPSP